MVSDGQEKDSGIRIHVSILPQTPLPFRLPHYAEHSSLLQLLLIFHFNCNCLLPLYRIITLLITFSTMLNKSGESKYSCFLPEFRRKTFSLSQLNMILATVFPQMSFINLKKFPFIPGLLRSCINVMDVVVSKDLSVSIEMIIYFLFFQSTNMMNYIN